MFAGQPEKTLLQLVEEAPAPSRDYGQLILTTKRVTFRQWTITSRHADDVKYHPKQFRETFEEYLHDDSCQAQVHRFFGIDTLNYTLNVAHGCGGFLHLPLNVFGRIVSRLELGDVLRLGSSCKLLRDYCDSDEVWRPLFMQRQGYLISPSELRTLEKATTEKEVTWKELFFTSLVRLRLQLRGSTFTRFSRMGLHRPESEADSYVCLPTPRDWLRFSLNDDKDDSEKGVNDTPDDADRKSAQALVEKPAPTPTPTPKPNPQQINTFEKQRNTPGISQPALPYIPASGYGYFLPPGHQQRTNSISRARSPRRPGTPN